MSRGSTQKDEGSPIDWIKIKSKHILFTDLSDSEVGILVRIQLLTALHERLLLRPEIEKHFHKRWLVSLEYKLSNIGVSIEYVMSKVLEDVEYVQSKRDAGKQRVRKYRADKECNALPERACNEADKIREDKRREDNPLPPVDLKYFHIANTGKTKTAVKNAVDRMDLSSQQKEEVIHDIGLIATSDFNADFISALQQCDNIVDRAISNSLEGFQFSKAFLEGR